MDDERRETEKLEDGRPAEVREGREPQADVKEEDIPDPSTVESVGY